MRATGFLCALALVAGAGTAEAQGVAGTDAATPPDGAGAADPAEVVVTAQRRDERLVDTPISVFAASGEALDKAGVTNVAQLQQVVAGLHIDANGPNTQPTIRGVGSAISGPGLASNVATYVDGFYRPSMNSANFRFNDIASVQVLKGPQGTLFGRNATGGAILLTTEQPGDEVAVRGYASYASRNTVEAVGYAALPVADGIAASVAGFVAASDGNARNVFRGGDEAPYTDWGVRTKLRAAPGGGPSFLLSYEHSESHDAQGIAFGAYRGWSNGALIPGAVVATRPNRTSLDTDSVVDVRNDALLLRSDLDIGFATLTSYSGAIWEDVFNQLDLDASSAAIQGARWNIHQRTITQEVDLASKAGGPLQWVAGFYYYDDDQIYRDFDVSIFGSPYFVAFARAGQAAQSLAGFTDVTWEVTGRLFLTGGLRYSHDKITEDYVLGTVLPGHASSSSDEVTPRAVIRYELTPRSNVYASFSQGYKSAVYNVFGAASTPVRPEKINAYELGYKMSRRGFNAEIAAFYYDYADLQINTYLGASSLLLNAASSRIYGVDANMAADVSPNLQLSLSAAYTHGRYSDFPNDPAYTFDPVAGVQIGTMDGDGLHMQRLPSFQCVAGAEYHRPVAGGTGSLRADVSYQTRVFFDPAEVTSQDGYGLVNLRAAWTAPSERWTIAVFGRNVTDTRYITQVLPGSFAFGQTWGDPATVGAELRFRY